MSKRNLAPLPGPLQQSIKRQDQKEFFEPFAGRDAAGKARPTGNAPTYIDGLQVTYLPTGMVRPNPKSPRLHGRSKMRRLVRAIAKNGIVSPLLVDRNNMLIAGHARWEAARELGLDAVPVIRLSGLTEQQALALMVADNKLVELGEWGPKLREVVLELSVPTIDFSLDLTGLSSVEVDLILADKPSDAPGPDPADLVGPISGEPVSKAGDLWLLGPHRLLCSDALLPASYQILMRDERATLVFTDPPYNVRIDGHATGKGKNRHREFAMAVGEQSPAQFSGFLEAVFVLLADHSIDGSVHFVCMDFRHQREILLAGYRVYDTLLNLCVWSKTNGGMGSLYRSQHELVYVFKNGTAPHKNNVQLGKNGRNRTNVWSYPSPLLSGKSGEEADLLALHPTPKPVRLIADAMLDCSDRGDIVLDCFTGIGATLLAAERVGRLFRGIEIDPLYVDATIRRWQRLTGDHAVHEATGRRFDDLAGGGD